MTLSLSLGLGLTTLKQGGGVPAGYTWLRGKQDDGSYVILRGLTQAGNHIKLSGKVS